MVYVVKVILVFIGIFSQSIYAMDPFDSGVWKHIIEGHFYHKNMPYKNVIVNEKTQVVSAEFCVKNLSLRKTFFPKQDEQILKDVIIRAYHNQDACCSTHYGLSFKKDPETNLYVGLFSDGKSKTAYPVLTYISLKQFHDAMKNNEKLHVGVFAKYDRKKNTFALSNHSYEVDPFELKDLVQKGKYLACDGQKIDLKDISEFMDPKLPKYSVLVETDSTTI